MQEALRLVVKFCFEELKLHRVAANYQPNNIRSKRLLDRLGFLREGYAKSFLYIDGAWRDHVLAALVTPSPAAPEVGFGWQAADQWPGQYRTSGAR